MNIIRDVRVAETGGGFLTFFGQLKGGRFYAMGDITADRIAIYDSNYMNSFGPDDPNKWERRHCVDIWDSKEDVRDFKTEMIQAMYRQGGFSTDFIENLESKIK